MALFLMLVSAGLGAQSAPVIPWRWSNPSPHGNNIYDLGFQNGVYWQVTDRGRIYRSTDRTIWTLVESGTTAALRGIAFRDDEVLICGESGVVLSGTLTAGFGAQTVTPPTSAWLEAIATSTNLAVAVGDDAAVYLREAGDVWNRVTGLGFGNWLRGVTYGAGVFVMVGEDGFIASSADGRVWQTQRSPTTAHLNRIVFVNDAFYACGNDGVLLRGTQEGSRWDLIALGTAGQVYSYAAELLETGTPTPLELVSGDLVLNLKSRPNGPWEDQLAMGSILPAPAWSYYASMWDGERFVVGGRTGMLIESDSAGDVAGTLWYEVSDGPRDWLWDVLALPDQYVTVGDRAAILTSENGVDWYRESVPSWFTDQVFLGVGGSPEVVVVVGSSGSVLYSPSVITNILSTNMLVTLEGCEWHTNTVVVTNAIDLQGLVWHGVEPPPTFSTLQGVAEQDGLIVVVGDSGTVLTGRDGHTWTNNTIVGNPNLSSVTAFRGGFVATGEHGAIYRSTDALLWGRIESGTTNWVYRVRRLGDLLIAVGQNGLILTSSDGTAWQAATSGVDAWLADAAKLDPWYFVCGTQGTVLASTNAVNWMPAGMITGKSLYGLAQRRGQLVTVGVEGVILRALIESGSEVQVIDYDHDLCDAILRDHFVLSGRPDQGVAIERSLDLSAWDEVARQWFIDAETALTLVRTNTPVRGFEYFRTRPIPP